MIVFVCKNHQENKNWSTFPISEIESTCIKIEISDLHSVKPSPIIQFPNISKIKFYLRFREILVYVQGKIYQKMFIESLIFSPKLAILTIFLPKSHYSNFRHTDG